MAVSVLSEVTILYEYSNKTTTNVPVNAYVTGSGKLPMYMHGTIMVPVIGQLLLVAISNFRPA